ncbi:MAG: DUF2161 family putative PD-(D/E)XK-type phosphodiesterase [Defluviitaleaceae bacterium]|nr:DUF2161 family putative PD-(D/E)XK-type phosphodiesterase [Defluviitaleaceae bacterium]
MKIKESDMYEPIRNLLISQGFIVRGEVKGCDIAAVSGDTLWVVEMKLSANITLIYQAMERQGLSDSVFVAIPRPRNTREGNFPALQKLLKKLNLGLITVAMDSPKKHAEIIFFPNESSRRKENKKTAAVKREIFGRTADSVGGTNKAKINTAYRERCVRIACLLEAKGPLSAKTLVGYGCEKDANTILRANYSGWFRKVEKGIYELTQAGRDYLCQNETASLVAYYRMKALEV